MWCIVYFSRTPLVKRIAHAMYRVERPCKHDKCQAEKSRDQPASGAIECSVNVQIDIPQVAPSLSETTERSAEHAARAWSLELVGASA
ncbi:uncharacterized protein SPSK_10935 [Sporothrix schenckii 1099-18]|uniref:Uncharacterized protein n=1 Tax=Sporothrix schenckii 1099-18 TaxID=1397361 RepID=A0A0F2M9J6_SPOSC|nr:uncharacterized protein SPSK_10935 [Sporothrix schenckii 1099-18]KJR85759.1 hypothetical protein SPSK_10935 [Sporothrix schenckii 1099-18]